MMMAGFETVYQNEMQRKGNGEYLIHSPEAEIWIAFANANHGTQLYH